MISASDLSEEQIATIRTWVSEGAQMADLQKRLKDDFNLSVTYMDTRFVALDLGLEFQTEEEEEEVEVLPAEEAPLPVSETPLDPEPVAEIPPTGGGVHATLDQVARPGAMVSGSVTFSDGVKGVWMIDEMGRPSVDPDVPNYEPTEADLVSFQKQLQVMLDGHV